MILDFAIGKIQMWAQGQHHQARSEGRAQVPAAVIRLEAPKITFHVRYCPMGDTVHETNDEHRHPAGPQPMIARF